MRKLIIFSLMILAGIAAHPQTAAPNLPPSEVRDGPTEAELAAEREIINIIGAEEEFRGQHGRPSCSLQEILPLAMFSKLSNDGQLQISDSIYRLQLVQCDQHSYAIAATTDSRQRQLCFDLHIPGIRYFDRLMGDCAMGKVFTAANLCGLQSTNSWCANQVERPEIEELIRHIQFLSLCERYARQDQQWR